MGLKTLTRIVLGIAFVVVGGLHSRRFGKGYAPDLHEDLSEEFKKGLKHVPFKEHIKMPSQQVQEIIAYTELICGLLLLTGQLVGLVVPVLMICMVISTYVAVKMDYELQFVAIPVVVCLALMSVCTGGQRKDKICTVCPD